MQPRGGCKGAHLGPLAGLETAVGVHPQQLAVAAQQVHIQEGLDFVLNEVHTAHTNTGQAIFCSSLHTHS